MPHDIANHNMIQYRVSIIYCSGPYIEYRIILSSSVWYKTIKYSLLYALVYYTRGTQDVQAQQVQATYGVLEKGDTRGDLAKLVGKWWRWRGGGGASPRTSKTVGVQFNFWPETRKEPKPGERCGTLPSLLLSALLGGLLLRTTGGEYVEGG